MSLSTKACSSAQQTVFSLRPGSISSVSKVQSCTGGFNFRGKKITLGKGVHKDTYVKVAKYIGGRPIKVKISESGNLIRTAIELGENYPGIFPKDQITKFINKILETSEPIEVKKTKKSSKQIAEQLLKIEERVYSARACSQLSSKQGINLVEKLFENKTLEDLKKIFKAFLNMDKEDEKKLLEILIEFAPTRVVNAFFIIFKNLTSEELEAGLGKAVEVNNCAVLKRHILNEDNRGKISKERLEPLLLECVQHEEYTEVATLLSNFLMKK